MNKSFFKVFFSKIKERQWLNKLGEEGYLLEKISDSKYYFVHVTDKVFKYSIEYLDCALNSDEAERYIADYKEINVVPVVTSGNWVYFVSETSDIKITEQICKKNSVPYFWRSLYLIFFSVCGAVFSGYHMFAIDYLERFGHVSDGRLDHFEIDSSGTAADKVFDLISSVINKAVDLINNSYLHFTTSIFGANDAVVVLSFLVPVVVILLIIAAFNIDEYISYRSLIKNIKGEDTCETCEVENDEKQAI